MCLPWEGVVGQHIGASCGLLGGLSCCFKEPAMKGEDAQMGDFEPLREQRDSRKTQ